MAVIAVDMDDVVADALGEHLRRYNEMFGTTIERTHLNGKPLRHIIPAEHRQAAHDLLHQHSFFEQLHVLPGAQEVLHELSRTHEVFFASAAMEVPCSFAAKFDWLHKHFAFIPPSNWVFCGDKHILAADYLIDDNARHFQKFRGTGILFDAPYNQHVTGYERVHNWFEVRDYFAQTSCPQP
ncbi:MAG: hypothetical protein U0105_12050 [Candidatus Obscuribacterales bacterium]